MTVSGREMRAGLAAALLISLLGCSGLSRGAAAKPGQKANAILDISLIAKSSTNPVFLSARTGAEVAARDLSRLLNTRIEIDWRTPPQEDGQLQAQYVAEAVNQGADAILISCSDAAKVTGAIDDAVERGVAVMTFDSDAPDSRRFACYGVDDLKTGARVMAELAALMGDKGKVAILAGNQNAPNLQKRAEGVRREAAKHPGIQIIGAFYHKETPQDAAREVISQMNAHPDIEGWAMIGGWALFAPSLVNDLDPKKVKLVSVDALPEELVFVEKGIAPVLLAQPTYNWGYESVRIIADKLIRKKEAPVFNEMELVRVTKENLGAWARQLKAWGFTDVNPEYLKLP